MTELLSTAPYLPLDDIPAGVLSPLALSVLERERAGRAAWLGELAGIPDPHRLTGRLLAQGTATDGRARVHTGRLRRWLEPLGGQPGLLSGVLSALGVPHRQVVPPPHLLEQLRPVWAGLDHGQEGGTLAAKARAAVGTRARFGPTADGLLAALDGLGTREQAALELGAALTLAQLTGLCRDWAGDRSGTLALDLLAGLGGGPGRQLCAIAETQVHSFLGRGQRAAFMRALDEARQLQRALEAQRRALAQAQADLQALAQAAVGPLGLDRTAAQHLRVSELVAALDRSLEPEGLRALAQARQATWPQPELWAQTPGLGVLRGAALQGESLAAGVREGPVYDLSGSHAPDTAPDGGVVPEGAVALLAGAHPEQLPLVQAAAALVTLDGGTVHSRLAAQARDLGQSAVALGGAVGWLWPGDLVRVNGSTGEVTVLRRAADADARPGLPPSGPPPSGLPPSGPPPPYVQEPAPPAFAFDFTAAPPTPVMGRDPAAADPAPPDPTAADPGPDTGSASASASASAADGDSRGGVW